MVAIFQVYVYCLIFLLCGSTTLAQSNPSVSGWTTKEFPDPRIDFAKCGSNSPGFLCDPDGLLRDEDRIALKKHVAEVERQSKKVFNKSQFCTNGAPDGLQFFIVLMNKIGGSPVGQTETQKFAAEIKAKYDIFKDVNTCDTTVVIVSSKKDGQLYTVAGRDAQLPGGTLESAFNRNVVHFAKGNFGTGLQEITSELLVAYRIAHAGSSAPETSESTASNPEANSVNNNTLENSGSAQKDDNDIVDLTPAVTTNGTNAPSDAAVEESNPENQTLSPSQAEKSSGNVDNETLPTLVAISDDVRNLSRNSALHGPLDDNVTLPSDSKSLWLNIVQITGNRCGTQHDPDAFMRNIRLVVEEIRDLSARLEDNEQYQTIQKMILKLKGDPDADIKAWNLGGRPYIEPLRQMLINQDGVPLSTACVNDIFN